MRRLGCSLVAQVSCCHSLCRHRAIRNDYGAMIPHSPTKNNTLIYSTLLKPSTLRVTDRRLILCDLLYARRENKGKELNVKFCVGGAAQMYHNRVTASLVIY